MTGEPVFSHLKLFKAPKERETPVMVRAPLACIYHGHILLVFEFIQTFGYIS